MSAKEKFAFELAALIYAVEASTSTLPCVVVQYVSPLTRGYHKLFLTLSYGVFLLVPVIMVADMTKRIWKRVDTESLVKKGR